MKTSRRGFLRGLGSAAVGAVGVVAGVKASNWNENVEEVQSDEDTIPSVVGTYGAVGGTVCWIPLGTATWNHEPGRNWIARHGGTA